jgi:hypothetical protein
VLCVERRGCVSLLQIAHKYGHSLRSDQAKVLEAAISVLPSQQPTSRKRAIQCIGGQLPLQVLRFAGIAA